ncbi:hypothetical protein [Nocardiopsis gilva]|uniref:hypothetical protein n=1 Tax=Nocardiopsis gilva TaxID=280236 RepID=UPI001268A77A|nr:hypothetical protein [Nocardiopsis gilva]
MIGAATDTLLRTGGFQVNITLKSVMAAAAAPLIAMSLLPGTALADDGPTRQEEREAVSQKVWSADDREAAVRDLSTRERELFQESLDSWTAKTAVSRFGKLSPTSPEVQEMGPGAEKIAAAGNDPGTEGAPAAGCWYHYQYDKWYDLGLNTGDTWMQLNWCHNGSRVTSHSVSNVGGQGHLGNEYEGVLQYHTRDVGWEIRKATQYKFNLFGASAQPCTQIRGGNGLYSTRMDCYLGEQ